MSDAAKALFDYALAKIIAAKEEGQALKVSVSLGDVSISAETVPQPVISGGGRSGWGKRAEAPSDLTLDAVKAKIAPLAGASKVEAVEGEGRFIVRPAQGAFLGDDWKPVMEALRPLGFQWSRDAKRFEVEHPNASKDPVAEAAEKAVTLDDAYKAIEESGFMDVLSAEARDGLVRINIKGSLGNDYKPVADALRKHGFTYNRELKNCFTAKLKETGQGPPEAPPTSGGAPPKQADKPTPPKKSETPNAAGEPLMGKDGSVLGALSVTGEDLVFTPAVAFNVDTPPFRSFLVDRVLEGMVTADQERVSAGELEKPLWYLVKEDNYRIVNVEVHGFGGERRLREITSALRWTFDKMLDKTREAPAEKPKPREPDPDPSFSRASGETVVGPEELKARSAVEGMLGSDQLRYEIKDGALSISPKKFLGDAWTGLNDALKGVGADWVNVKPTHWEITIKKPKAPPKKAGSETPEVEDIIDQIQEADKTLTRESIVKQIEGEQAKAAGLLTRGAAAHLVASQYLQGEPRGRTLEPLELSIEGVEKHLADMHGDLAEKRLAVTDNSTFIMVEPYQSLTPTEQAGFDKTLKGLGAEYRGDSVGWFIKKPKGGKA